MLTKILVIASAVAICVLAAGGSSAAASGNAASESSAKLQAALDSIVAAGVPGALVLVRDGDHVVRLASGYGNLARRTPMRVTDRFRVGSDTKTFVATVVLQLVGERKLALDDTVEGRLPGLVPNGRNITVRQLLNHMSGLYDYAEDKAFLAQLEHRTRVWTPRALVRIAAKHRPLFPPGRRWSYSNTGYTLLGLMVEKATGNELARSFGSGSSSRYACGGPASIRSHGSPAATRTATRRVEATRASTSASSTARSSEPRARSCRPQATSRGSTVRASVAASCDPTCWRRCTRRSPSRRNSTMASA
jgi:Beta-lactamase